MKVDLTRTTPTPLSVTHEPTGETVRFEFHRIFTRQQRAYLQRTVGRGANAKEVPDLKRMWREGIKSIEGVELNGHVEIITDPAIIVKVMETPENLGGLPEEMVTKVASYLLGENVLQDDAAVP